MGLSRTLTIACSEAIAKCKEEAITQIFWTSARLILTLSTIGFLILISIILNTDILASFLHDKTLFEDVKYSLLIFSFSIPIVTLTTAIKGVLESKMLFKTVNYLYIGQSVLTFLLPVVVLTFNSNLTSIVASLVLMRFFSLLLHLKYLIKYFKGILNISFLSFADFKFMLSQGAWMTVSQTLGPIIVYMDRFCLTLFGSSSTIAFYTTPAELTNKLQIIPNSLSRTLFPKFASEEKKSGLIKYGKSINVILLAFVPICILTTFFGRSFLQRWINEDFAKESYLILTLLTWGALFNALAQIPYAYIQAKSQSKLTAYIHICEFFFYVFLLAILISNYGVVGAALASAIRFLIDFLLLHFTALKIQKAVKNVY